MTEALYGVGIVRDGISRQDTKKGNLDYQTEYFRALIYFSHFIRYRGESVEINVYLYIFH